MNKSSFLFQNKWINIIAIIIVVLLSFLDKIIPPLGIPLALICILILFWWRKLPIRMLGIFKPDSWIKTILIGISVGTFITLFAFLVLSPIIQWAGISKVTPDVYKAIEGNNSMLIIYLVISWTTAGLGEELIYRSFFLGQFVSILKNVKYKWTLSLIISSIIFGIGHFNDGNEAIILTAINGFIIGLVYLKTHRNIWAAYVTHAFANTVEIIIIYFGLYKYFL